MKSFFALLLIIFSLAATSQTNAQSGPNSDQPPGITIVGANPGSFTVVIPNAYGRGIYPMPSNSKINGYYRNYDLIVEVSPLQPSTTLFLSKPGSFTASPEGMGISTSGSNYILLPADSGLIRSWPSKPRVVTARPQSVTAQPRSTTSR